MAPKRRSIDPADCRLAGGEADALLPEARRIADDGVAACGLRPLWRFSRRPTGQELAGLFTKIHQDRPGLGHGQGLSARTPGIDQGRDARSRVDLQVVSGLLVVLAEIEHMDFARNATLIALASNESRR